MIRARVLAAAAATSILAACGGANGPPPVVPTPGPNPQPAVSHVVCPGDELPPGYRCSPSWLCRNGPRVLGWASSWLVSWRLTDADRAWIASTQAEFRQRCGTAAPSAVPPARG